MPIFLPSYKPRRDACAKSGGGVHARVATFLATLHRQLERASKAPSSSPPRGGVSSPPPAGRSPSDPARYCTQRSASFSRHVASFWCDLAEVAAAAEDRAPSELLLGVADAFGVCALWAAAHLQTSSSSAVPICSLLPSNSSQGLVALEITMVPAASGRLAAAPDLMSRWLLPWVSSVMDQTNGSSSSLVWTLLTAVYREVGAFCKRDGGDASSYNAASRLLLQAFKSMLSIETAEPTHILQVLTCVEAASHLPLDFWACEQIDTHIQEASYIALGPPNDVDGESYRQDAVRLVVHASGRRHLLSSACVIALFELTASSISSCIGRRITSTLTLQRLKSALEVARALTEGLPEYSEDDLEEEERMEAIGLMAKGVAALLTSLYATLVTWNPASAWHRTAISSNAPSTAADAPSTTVFGLLAEAADSPDDEGALAAVAMEPAAAMAAAEGAIDAEEEEEALAEADRRMHGADEAEESEMQEACTIAADVWRSLAGKASIMINAGVEGWDEMEDGMRRLASSIIPNELGYAKGWRDGGRRWAWAVRELQPLSCGSRIGEDVESADAWQRALLSSRDGVSKEAWRLCMLALSLMQSTDLEKSVPSSGELFEDTFHPNVLVWLLLLHHAASAAKGEDADTAVSSTLTIELKAFVCGRILPYLRKLSATQASTTACGLRLPLDTDAPSSSSNNNLLKMIMHLSLSAACGAGSTGSSLFSTATASAAATILRCILDAFPSLDERRKLADDLLTSWREPSKWAPAQPPTVPPTLMARLGRVIMATTPITAESDPSEHGGADVAGSNSYLTELSDSALKEVMSLRPTASAAARAASRASASRVVMEIARRANSLLPLWPSARSRSHCPSLENAQTRGVRSAY